MAAKKVNMLVGFVPIATRIEVAVDKESSGLHTVCTDNGSHDPARCKQFMECPICLTRHSSHYGFTERAAERDGQLVVLTRDELAGEAGEAVTGGKDKPPVEVVFHPREKVEAATVFADSVQNIYPDKGSEKAYALLRDTLAARPDVVACMIWSPGTKNALWTLKVVGHRIVAEKRCWPEQVRPTVEVPMAEVTDVERDMFSQFIDSSVSDFDLGRYVDDSKRSREELIASRKGTAITGSLQPGMAARADVPDLMAAIEASLAAAGAKPKPRKTAVKKTPVKAGTKKAAAPRKRTAKKASPALPKSA